MHWGNHHTVLVIVFFAIYGALSYAGDLFDAIRTWRMSRRE